MRQAPDLAARLQPAGASEDAGGGVRPNRCRVVVVGPCASGKSTLVGGLRSLGYQAVVCGQEHSEISSLWRRSAPDVLIALDVDLETVRRRRGLTWSAAIYDRQRQRLAEAMAAADLVLDASTLTEAAVLARVLRTLELIDPGNGR
jgi:dephospho-CoA kinase